MTSKKCVSEATKDITPGQIPALVENDSWQNQVARQFSLERAGDRFTLFDDECEILTFSWKDIAEIQYLRRESFPPTMWKVVSEHGCWLVPDGGGYAKALTDEIYALPGYHLQQAVTVAPDTGFTQATSLWRRSDSFPPRNPSDFEDIDW